MRCQVCEKELTNEYAEMNIARFIKYDHKLCYPCNCEWDKIAQIGGMRGNGK